MPVKDFKWENGRGHNLFCISVLPDQPTDIQASVVFQHGYAEHAGRKLAAFQHLAAAGVAVYAFDVAGFGRSEPLDRSERAMVHRYEHLVDDLCGFGSCARQWHQSQGLPDVPWFLAGFSLGGLTAAHAALRQQQQWAGLVLVSACMWVFITPLTRLQRAIGPVLNATVPYAKIVQKLDPVTLNPDPEHVADYVADELVYRDNTRVSTALQMGRMLDDMKLLRGQLQLPLYAVHSTNDLITPYQDLLQFFYATCSTDKQLKTIVGGYHDLIAGKETEQHVRDIATWMLQHVECMPRN